MLMRGQAVLVRGEVIEGERTVEWKKTVGSGALMLRLCSCSGNAAYLACMFPSPTPLSSHVLTSNSPAMGRVLIVVLSKHFRVKPTHISKTRRTKPHACCRTGPSPNAHTARVASTEQQTDVTRHQVKSSMRRTVGDCLAPSWSASPDRVVTSLVHAILFLGGGWHPELFGMVTLCAYDMGSWFPLVNGSTPANS